MSRWVIVSNRLPFNYDADTGQLKQSSGGLVTAIKGIQSKNDMLWVGTLPNDIPKKAILEHEKSSNMKYSYPQLPPELYDSYYNDFCNDVLWPILHYETDIVKFRESAWEDYKTVNKIFAEHLAKTVKSDDVIWLHDFHLFLVPQMLKKLRPELRIGFFLHVPFPSSEIYKQLPCREKILQSLLHCDLIGFHDYSYLRHFVNSVYSVMGIHSSFLEISSPYNNTRLGVYPVSINTKTFIQRANSKKTASKIKTFQLGQGGMDTILGVDRLDYTKGIPNKLEAFRCLLKTYPELIGKVQLLQIAVPSRTHVEEYINLRHEIEQLVSEINGEFGKINYIPIKYIFNSVSHNELMALYRSSRVLFVTSKRDGMNLVCLEYVAAQDPKSPGVILLSEFAGAASSLSHATLVNPFDVHGCAEKLKDALSLSRKEAIKRHQPMFEYLREYTATAWAESFLNHLNSDTMTEMAQLKDLTQPKNLKIVKSKAKKKNKILMIDYDGTLTPIVDNPAKAHISADMKNSLKTLQRRKDVEVVVVTGRDEKFITQQLKGLNCFLACEHGARFYDYKEKRWRSLASTKKQAWYKNAIEVMKEYTRRTPNSFIERKEFAIAWHYRNSPTEFGNFQARKLAMDLESTLAHFPVGVIEGKKVVEVKAIEANKGYFAEWFLSRYSEDDDFIFAVGDDRTDEDLFGAIDGAGTSVKVGASPHSKAQYFINSQDEVKKLLKIF